MKQAWEERVAQTKHPLAKRLLQLILIKQTNLSVSADVTTKAELLALAEAVGPFICILKTHIDIIEDFDQDLITQLKAIAQKHQFLLFEDRKFADIGNTVKLQYSKGLYHIADWADIINAHILPGAGIMEGLKQVGLPKGRGLLLLAQMSSKQNYFTEAYTKAAIKLAEAHRDFVIGFIAQQGFGHAGDFITMTPGISAENTGDSLGQGYITPEEAIIENGSDIIIVGRSIYGATHPEAAARHYQKQGWQAYLQAKSG